MWTRYCKRWCHGAGPIPEYPEHLEGIRNQAFDPRTAFQFFHLLLIIDLGHWFIDLCGPGLRVLQGLWGCSSCRLEQHAYRPESPFPCYQNLSDAPQ